MKRVALIVVLVGVTLLVGCTAGPNTLMNVDRPEGDIAGFWNGLWHGFISPVAFIVSLFSDRVSVYEVHNNGNWYNFGFLLGASMIFGGSGGGAARRRRRSTD